MSAASADRNLLYGVLALQMGFVSRDQLIEALHAWMPNRDQSLTQVLLGKGLLGEQDHVALDLLAQRHLARHQHDAARCLAALPVADDLARVLSRAAHAELSASL